MQSPVLIFDVTLVCSWFGKCTSVRSFYMKKQGFVRSDHCVCEQDGVLTGVAVLNHIIRPETPYMRVRDDLDIDEFCADEAHRRSGIGTELMTFIRSYAKEKGFAKVELNMGEFNEDALRFYESVGFSTYRRYTELPLS